MAHRAANGWIAPLPEGGDFTVQESRSRKSKNASHCPTGVFIHEGPGRVYVNYAGVEAADWTFELPKDPDFLRDVADALQKLASDLDKRRGRS